MLFVRSAAQGVLVSSLVALIACTDEGEPLGGGGGGASPPLGGGATGAGGGGGQGGHGGAAPSCDQPASAEIGPEGGELSHCGATLTVPPAAVSVATTFSIAIDPAPPAPPFERELASPLFHLTPEAPALEAPVSLRIEHEAADSRFELATVIDGSFAAIEACEVTTESQQQWIGVLGRWAVLRNLNDYPSSPSGLGDGTMALDFLGETPTYDLDDSGAYGIFQADASGGRNVTLIGQRDVAGGIEQLRIDLYVSADGQSDGLIQVSWISTVLSGGYTFIDGLLGTLESFEVTETPQGRLVGSLAVTVEGGDPVAEEPLALAFDVTAEAYAFPSELSCPFGE
ncbi:MAG: hypothetical protein IPM79_17335 [Polyangiaceae bacterium]|jgi:hypothetical protein|nr:hypothetical protein [Polyangiaceae bacterium]MBK8939331.1 hypothetical protein [Polyangiaceae bacterium]